MGLAKWVRPLLGITLIAFSICMFVELWFPIVPRSPIADRYLMWNVISYILFMIGGIAVLLLKNKGTYIIVGAATLTLGVADMISETVTLIDMANFGNIMRLIFTAILALVPLMDLFLAIFSIRYMQGHKRNAIRMSVCICVPLIIWVLAFLLAMLMARNNMTQMLYVLSYYIPYIALYSIFFVALVSPGIREDFTEWRLYEMSEDMYKTMIIDPKSTIYRGDLLTLNETLKAPEKWEESKTVPNSKECYALFGKDMNIRRMTFLKIDGTDKIRVSIIGEGEKAYIQGARFDFNGMLPLEGDFETCKSVRFIGEKGFFIDISIRDDDAVPRDRFLIDRVLRKIKSIFKRKKSV